MADLTLDLSRSCAANFGDTQTYLNGLRSRHNALASSSAAIALLALDLSKTCAADFDDSDAYLATLEAAVTALENARPLIQTKPVDPAGPANSITWAWTGAPTADTITVTHRLAADATRARLVVSEAPDMSAPLYSTAPVPSVSRYVKQTVAGLKPGTTYYHALMIDGVVDTSKVGRFRTKPAVEGPRSFSFVVAGCSIPNTTSPVWAAILAKSPLFMLAAGDTPYGDSIAPYTMESALDAYLTSSAAPVYRQMPVLNMWSDHDFPSGPTSGNGANDVTGASVGQAEKRKALARARAVWPNPAGYAAGVDDPVGFSYIVGRVRLIVPDCRSQMVAGSTKLGASQLAWVKSEMSAAKAAGQITVLFTESVFNAATNAGSDTWGAVPAERQTIIDHAQSIGMADRQLLTVCSDSHATGIDDGTNSPAPSSGTYRAPMLLGGALDQATNALRGTFSNGVVQGKDMFGFVTVTDDGTAITVKLEGFKGDGTAISGVTPLTWTLTNAALTGTTATPAPPPSPTPAPTPTPTPAPTPEVKQAAIATRKSPGAGQGAGFDVSGTYPAAPTNGNLLLLIVGTDKADAGGSVTTPSGWTRVPSLDSGAPVSAAFYKISNGTETSVTVTYATPNIAPGTLAQMAMMEFSGAASIDFAARSSGFPSAKSATVSGTASAGNIRAVAVSLIDSGTSVTGSTRSWSDGFAEVAQYGFSPLVPQADPVGSIATKSITAAGAVSTAFAYADGASDEIVAWMIGVKPVS